MGQLVQTAGPFIPNNQNQYLLPSSFLNLLYEEFYTGQCKEQEQEGKLNK